MANKDPFETLSHFRFYEAKTRPTILTIQRDSAVNGRPE